MAKIDKFATALAHLDKDIIDIDKKVATDNEEVDAIQAEIAAGK